MSYEQPPMRNPSGTNDPTESNRTVFEAMPVDEPTNAPNLAEQTGMPKATVDKSLRRLHDAGVIERKKLGHTTVVWWRPAEAEYDP